MVNPHASRMFLLLTIVGNLTLPTGTYTSSGARLNRNAVGSAWADLLYSHAVLAWHDCATEYDQPYRQGGEL